MVSAREAGLSFIPLIHRGIKKAIADPTDGIDEEDCDELKLLKACIGEEYERFENAFSSLIHIIQF
jgi:hypothetical protein